MGRALSIRNWVGRAQSIEEKPAFNLKEFNERIRTLKIERTHLLAEIENLKKEAESKANALETEVNMLREEVKSFKNLLGIES